MANGGGSPWPSRSGAISTRRRCGRRRGRRRTPRRRAGCWRRLLALAAGAGCWRWLLALAAVYDGATRTEAAKVGGGTLPIVRDWVLRFHAEGPDGLVARKAPGPASHPG
jgi:hypothetical protein